MDKLYATVSSKGQLVIPAALRTSLGIEAGTRIAFFQDGMRMILEPETVAAKMRLIDELCGITAGGPSGTEMLLEDRRRERAMELAKDGW
jgi:AbrB family looped-hinge helix DNA binding protein